MKNTLVLFAIVFPSKISIFYWFKPQFFQRKGVDLDPSKIRFSRFPRGDLYHIHGKTVSAHFRLSGSKRSIGLFWF